MIEYEKHKQIKSFLKDKTISLWKHENDIKNERGEEENNMVQYGFPIDLCFPCNVDGTPLYFIFNETFLNIINKTIFDANEKHPDAFGTGNAKDVLDALYDVSKFLFSKEEYIDFLKNFACCYVIFEIAENCFSSDILRVDLFRKLKKNKENQKKDDFVGGLLHTLKHFNVGDKCLSTESKGYSVADLSELLNLISAAFLKRERDKNDSKSKFISYLYVDGKPIKFIFYKEETTGVFFLDSCYRTKTKNMQHLQPNTTLQGGKYRIGETQSHEN